LAGSVPKSALASTVERGKVRVVLRAMLASDDILLRKQAGRGSTSAASACEEAKENFFAYQVQTARRIHFPEFRWDI
jgi:hypothetical protein